MSRDENPFEVSGSSYGDRAKGDREASTAEVSSRTIELLNQTRPWVRLFGILTWIGTVLMAFVAIGMLVAGAAGPMGAGGVLIAVVYGFMALLYGFIASKLMAYGRYIHRLSQTEEVRDLEAAIDAQRSFWKTIGIITAVILILYAVFFVLMIAGVAFMGQNVGR